MGSGGTRRLGGARGERRRAPAQPLALAHKPGPRAILERAGKLSAACVRAGSARRREVPAVPTHPFKLRVLWKLPGGSSGGVPRSEACGENPTAEGSLVFSSYGGKRTKDGRQLLTLLSVTLPWKAGLLEDAAAVGFPELGSGRRVGSGNRLRWPPIELHRDRDRDSFVPALKVEGLRTCT